jgi:4-amino-4-deoxy-L-arabinose transferase-like glycosyltransferase
MLAARMPVTLPPAARAAVAVAVLAGLAALTRVSSWRKPLATDSGQYLYIGDLILHGGTPYVDAVNNKGPMTYLLFAVIRLGAGTSMTVVRLCLLAFAVIAAVALGAYVARLATREAGVLAAIAFALFAGLPAMQGDDPNTEQFGIAFIVGAWWLATHAGRWWAFGAGASVAAAVAMNPAFAVALPFVAFELWRARGGDPSLARLRRLGLGVLGGVAVVAPILLWLLARGALDDMWDQVVDYATRVSDGSFSRGGVPPSEPVVEQAPPSGDGGGAGEGPVGGGGGDGKEVFGPPGRIDEWRYGTWALPERGLWVVGVAGLLLACTERRLRRAALPMLAWVVACWARVKGATYEFPHHYYPVVPGLAAGLALGVARLWTLIPRRALVRYAVAVVVFGVPLWLWVGDPEREALDYPAGLRWGSQYESFSLAYPVAEFVREHTRPDEKILVVGTDPEVYWLADRRANTPYFDAFRVNRSPEAAALRSNDVVFDPPAAIVAMPDAEDADPAFPALLNLGQYPPAFELRGARVWLRKR